VSFSLLLQEFFLGMGVDWVLYLLVGLSVVSVGVIIERAVFYGRRKVAPDDVRALARGDTSAAPSHAMERRIADRLAAAVTEGLARADAEQAVEADLRKLRGSYESGLTFLATLGNNAPFVGLLGTVLGIMAAFFQLSAVADAAQKNEMLMTHISEALIATAMGLVVAIPAVAFYNVFRRRVSLAVEHSREIATRRARDAWGNGNGNGGNGHGSHGH
jgi:biopolymer transport protein ExbB